jgi:GNAT superfamily N-acetyltransferase
MQPENTDRSQQFSKKELDFSVENEVKADVSRLITTTLYGVDGGLRYRHQNASERIEQLHSPDFLAVGQNGQAFGTSVNCKRNISLNDKNYQGFYMRYFSVDSAQRGKGAGTQLMSHADDYYRATVTEPAVFYAYIELDNIRSMKVSTAFNVHPIGKFRTVFFSRFFPKLQTGVEHVSLADQAEVRRLLEDQYSEHAFVNFQRIFSDDNYFVLKKNGQIVAGAQANKVGWIIEQVPGFSGWMTMNLIPHLPILGRLFNPKNYQFTAFEGIYCKEGHESELVNLFEHVLAEQGTYSAMCWFDPRCPVYKRTHGKGNYGFLGKVQKSPPANVVAEFMQVPESEIETFKQQPIYISAFDLT